MPSHLNPDGTVAIEPAADDSEARALAIVNCGLCDDQGYRGARVCDHVDRAETAKRGSALVRAELAKIQARKAKPATRRPNADSDSGPLASTESDEHPQERKLVSDGDSR